MTQNLWDGGLQSKSTKEVFEEFRKSLADNMARVESAEALMLLNEVREELLKEISAGKCISAGVKTLIEKLAEIPVADESKEAVENFLNVVALQMLVLQHLAEVNPG